MARWSENETKFGRQVGGRETINYGGSLEGSVVCLTRGCASSQAVGAPRQLWIKQAAWPQPLVPASNGSHRASPRATWQRAICYFALSATRSLINLAALFAGRSACFIPRSGRHIPPDSLPLSLFLCFLFREFDRSTRRRSKEKVDAARWIGSVSIAVLFLSVFSQWFFLNRNKKKRRKTILYPRSKNVWWIYISSWIISFSLKFTTSLVPAYPVHFSFFHRVPRATDKWIGRYILKH